MILSRSEMLSVERKAFESTRTNAEALMDEVGRRMANTIRRLASPKGPGLAIVFLGKGNNAGDGLVVAEHLAGAGWTVGLRLAGDVGLLGDLAGRKLQRLCAERTIPRWSTIELARLLDEGNYDSSSPLIAIDGLLGIGAKGELRSPIREAAQELNRLRRERGAQVFALDLPTGVDADGADAPDLNSIVADVTLAAGFTKAGLVEDRAVDLVGHLEVIDLQALDVASEQLSRKVRPSLTVRRTLSGLLRPRGFESNKTDYGRIGIVAGAVGTTGAAAMCAVGALRAGAGLVTLLVPEKIYPTAAMTAAPEVMVKPIKSFLDALEEKFDVIAVGPGLSPHEGASELCEMIEKWPHLMVVDAGAITALAQDTGRLARCAGPRLLTPHPGEMDRLWQGDPILNRREMKSLPRAEIVSAFCERYPAVLLLKGARTLVGQRGQSLAYNSTGNPGMASGGMGDILTGVCAALLGQGLSAYNAANMGAFLCGRAAEYAIQSGEQCEESLLALDLPRYFPRVFGEIRRGDG